MKKIFTLILVCMISVPVAAQLTATERDMAINYLMATQQDIINTVSELSEEEWNYTPENGGWSVANCLEHILVSETAFTGMTMNLMSATTADPMFTSPANDGMLIGMMANRGTKVTTSPQMEPSDRWSSKAEMLSALEQSRKTLAETIKNTDKDLRHVKAETPMGVVDSYQMFLLIGAHSQRHTAQMKEVLAELNNM